MTTITEARAAARRDYAMGEPRKHNPYLPAPLYDAWDDEWQQAAAEAEKSLIDRL